MKKQTAIVIAIILILLSGGYYGYKKYSDNNIKQSTDKIAKDTKAESEENNKNSNNEKLKKIVTDAVSKAESSKTQTDIDKARKSIDALPVEADKDTLNKRLDKIDIADNKSKDTITWLKSPQYSGIKTSIEGAIDIKKIKQVKAFVDDKEITITLNSDGTFLIDCGNVDPGKVVKVKAYDVNNKEVSSKDVTRLL